MSQEKSQNQSGADLNALFDEIFAEVMAERGNPAAGAPDIVASLDESSRAQFDAAIKALGELFSNIQPTASAPDGGDDHA